MLNPSQPPLINNPPPIKPKPKWRWGWVISLLLVLMIAGFFLADFLQPRIWWDYYIRSDYQPDSQVTQLIDRLAFTQRGKNVFLASSPVVSDADRFNEQCARREATISILGCYDDQNIYIYHVSEPKLSGIMETTAAHELLHAVYVRLNQFERPKVDELIMANYEKFKTPELEQRLEYYRRIDPDSITNELHSILGTELTQLSPALEDYYSRYFTNRSVIVDFYKSYHQQFVDLSSKAEELKQQIDAMLPEITVSQKQYTTKLDSLNHDIELFNQRADGGHYTSQWQFNRDRQTLLARINSIEDERQYINNLVDKYNQLIEDYNNNATQYQKLNQSINSLSQAPTL